MPGAELSTCTELSTVVDPLLTPALLLTPAPAVNAWDDAFEEATELTVLPAMDDDALLETLLAAEEAGLTLLPFCLDTSSARTPNDL